MNRPPPLPQPVPPPLRRGGPPGRHPALLTAAVGTTMLGTIGVIFVAMSFGRGRPVEPRETVATLDLDVPSSPGGFQERTRSTPGAKPAADAPVPERSPPDQAASEMPESAVTPREPLAMAEVAESDANAADAADRESPVASESAAQPGGFAPRASAATWALVETVALPRRDPGGIDSVPGQHADGVDLGPCAEEAARRLTWDIAVPEDAWTEEGPRLVVAVVEEGSPRWAVRWSDVAAGVEDAADAAVATIAASDGRLWLHVSRAVTAETLGVLARSVLVAASVDDGSSHEVRLAVPIPVPALAVDLFGKPATAKLSLPRPIRGADLTRGGCRIDLEFAGERHALDVAAGAADGAVGSDYAILDFSDESQLGVHVEFAPASTVITVKPTLYGPEARRDWLATFAELADGDDDTFERVLRDWDKRVGGIVAMSLQAAATKAGGDRIDAFVGQPLLLPGGFALRSETVQVAMNRWLGDARGRDRWDGRRGANAWADECTQVLRAMRNGVPPQTQTHQGDWQRAFSDPLRQWWATYRTELETALRDFANDLRTTRDRARTLTVLRVVTTARNAAGGKFEATLARFDEPPPSGEDSPIRPLPELD